MRPLDEGGEPTFVSIDDMEGEEWNTAAVGPTKRLLASQLLQKTEKALCSWWFAAFGPRQMVYRRATATLVIELLLASDGQPIWTRPDLIADEKINYGHGIDEARRFGERLAQRLGVSTEFLISGYEDAWAYMLRERRLPVNVEPTQQPNRR